MANHTSYLAIIIFLAFVGFTLGLSFWLGRRAKTAGGYFAAHGQIGWFVNGIAFAGDYLSAASFLGICGMIAFYGYDGFLYSIGFLAGWVVALFVIAEPIKRLGKYTFADALDAKFNSRGIRLAAAISTLVVSMFYLIPQMVGAGSLIVPLLGIAHYWGVLIVGGVVILIVVTAGMVSTTWVQFIKGSLLVIFCAVLVVMILRRGISGYVGTNGTLYPFNSTNYMTVRLIGSDKNANDALQAREDDLIPLHRVGGIEKFKITAESPAAFIHNLSTMFVTRTVDEKYPGLRMTYANFKPVAILPGDQLLLPGGYFKGIRGKPLSGKLDFISLMLALFCGTASLPHILIRYYTVKDAAAARKSTVVGIIAIGFFYVLTLYIGLGAMVSGNLDPTDSNMAAPLLARTFGELPFALITAIAFTTVLGTVSGLILASAGAVAHDLTGLIVKEKLTGEQQVRVAKIASIAVGLVAIVLGIVFKSLNVGFLVGWAFNVAASANLPAIIALLFWRGTTRQGMVASIFVGLISSVTWLLLTKEAFQNVYGIAGHTGYVPFSQPGLVTIPLSFAVVFIVSAFSKGQSTRGFAVEPLSASGSR